MTEWEDEIRGSERIFIRASTHGKKSFWGYEGAVLDKTDERIRTFPFPTRRPVSGLRDEGPLELTTDTTRAPAVLARAHPGQGLPPVRGGAHSAGRGVHSVYTTQETGHQACRDAGSRAVRPCRAQDFSRRRGSRARSMYSSLCSRNTRPTSARPCWARPHRLDKKRCCDTYSSRSNSIRQHH
jgi:hypothetical protein